MDLLVRQLLSNMMLCSKSEWEGERVPRNSCDGEVQMSFFGLKQDPSGPFWKAFCGGSKERWLCKINQTLLTLRLPFLPAVLGIVSFQVQL